MSQDVVIPFPNADCGEFQKALAEVSDALKRVGKALGHMQDALRPKEVSKGNRPTYKKS